MGRMAHLHSSHFNSKCLSSVCPFNTPRLHRWGEVDLSVNAVIEAATGLFITWGDLYLPMHSPETKKQSG